MSRSDLLPAITMGTLGKFFLLDLPTPPEPEIALNLVSKICSRNRTTSSKDSRESMLKTSTNKSPKTNEGDLLVSQEILFGLHSSIVFIINGLAMGIPVRKESLRMAGKGWLPEVSTISSW